MAKARKYIDISRQQFVEMFQGLKVGTFVGLSMSSEPTWARKTDNPFVGRVLKVQSMSGMIGYDYEGNVNKALEKQGEKADFKAQKPAWGTRVGESCLIEHKGQFYFDMRVLRSLKVKYMLDGKKIDKAKIADWLRKSSPATAGVVVRRPKIDNIQKVHVLGVKYRLTD